MHNDPGQLWVQSVPRLGCLGCLVTCSHTQALQLGGTAEIPQKSDGLSYWWQAMVLKEEQPHWREGSYSPCCNTHWLHTARSHQGTSSSRGVQGMAYNQHLVTLFRNKSETDREFVLPVTGKNVRTQQNPLSSSISLNKLIFGAFFQSVPWHEEQRSKAFSDYSS